jgi:hypothetical protein
VTLGRSQVIKVQDEKWTEVLSRLKHDVYHTREYHLCSGFRFEGEPNLFCYSEGEKLFVWPYLLNTLDTLPGCEGCGYYDVTSVYGYAGPLASSQSDFVERGWRALLEHWRMQRVVSSFTRFHPLLDNSELLTTVRGIGEEPAAAGITMCGSTVSMNLTMSSTEQLRLYPKVLRQEIRKSRELGFHTFKDEQWCHIADFTELYADTLQRVNGNKGYLFDFSWVSRFRSTMGDHSHLMITMIDDVVAAALLVMEYNGYLHAHLAGIRSDLISYSPLKVLLDDVRNWGSARGNHTFHLGGGVGGREDSLFHFKRRFSPQLHEFRIGCWILDRATYSDLEAARRDYFVRCGPDHGNPAFFPAYRCPPSSVGGVGLRNCDSQKAYGHASIAHEP